MVLHVTASFLQPSDSAAPQHVGAKQWREQGGQQGMWLSCLRLVLSGQ